MLRAIVRAWDTPQSPAPLTQEEVHCVLLRPVRERIRVIAADARQELAVLVHGAAAGGGGALACAAAGTAGLCVCESCEWGPWWHDGTLILTCDDAGAFSSPPDDAATRLLVSDPPYCRAKASPTAVNMSIKIWARGEPGCVFGLFYMCMCMCMRNE
jgi:hypothetical protein